MSDSILLFGDYNRCKMPILSILIPTFGRAEFLEQAIESAISQNEHSVSYEILVVSNDPNDSMEKIISKFHMIENLFIYRNSENIGMVGNSNRCIELSKGKYVAFLHDDDYLLPNYMQEVSKQILTRNDRKCFITGRYVLFEQDCKAYRNALLKQRLHKVFGLHRYFRGEIKTLNVSDNLYAGTNCYLSPSCGTVIDKQAFYAAGGFCNKISYSWDLDFFLHLNLKEQIHAGYEPVAVYRIGNNASLRREVKFDFFDYFRTNFLDLFVENHICTDYVAKHRNEIIASIYVQWADDISIELRRRGENAPEVKRYKQLKHKISNLLYFYFHNLDFQKAMVLKMK